MYYYNVNQTYSKRIFDMCHQLKTYLDVNHISVNEFSRLINVHKSTLYNYLAGRRMPKIKTMKKIVLATSGNVNFLFHEEEKHEEEEEIFTKFIMLYIKNTLKNTPLKLLSTEMEISTSALSQKIHGKIAFSKEEIEFLLRKSFE